MISRRYKLYLNVKVNVVKTDTMELGPDSKVAIHIYMFVVTMFEFEAPTPEFEIEL